MIPGLLKTAAFVACLVLMGCGYDIRHPANHSIWHTKFPKHPDYKGVVFILHSPPGAEFAFLLAQKYPESYIVCHDPINYQKDWIYIYGESRKIYGFLKPGDTIRRMVHLFPSIKYIEISVTTVTLERYLIFHHMKLISRKEIPQPLFGLANIQLKWSQMTNNKNNNKNPSTTLSPILITSNHGQNRENPSSTQVLDIILENQESIEIVAHDRAENILRAGPIIFFLLSLFYQDTVIPEFTWAGSSNWFSPGGWADCLEQMFQNPRINQVSRLVNEPKTDEREEWFSRVFDTEGFFLEQIPLSKRYSTTQLFLIPPNPIINVYLDDFFTPRIKFGSMKWPYLCLLKPNQGMTELSYYWYKCEKERNWLAPVLEVGDKGWVRF